MRSGHRYEAIADELRERIEAGVYHAVGRLPSERLLSTEFAVQRNTLRAAIELLVQSGHLITEGRRGAFLTPTFAANARSLAARLRGRNAVLLYEANPGSISRQRVLAGMQPVFQESGVLLSLIDPGVGPGRVGQDLPRPKDLGPNAAGVLMWPKAPVDMDALEALRAKFPLVLLDRRVPGIQADCVMCDDEAGGHEITRHLLDRGHRRIGFVGDEVFAEPVFMRWRGYARAIQEHGLPVDAARFALYYGIEEPVLKHRLRELTDGPERITALVCSNDVTATRVIEVLRDLGLRVPEDVAVTGYGNIAPTYVDAIGLTTVEQPFEELGRRAAQLLLKRMLDPQPDAGRRSTEVRLPVRLVLRRTA